MKITIEKDCLYKWINKVQRATGSGIIALTGGLFEAEGQDLKISATDLEIAIQHTIRDITVDEPGKALIPARFFNEVLRKLSGPITLETEGIKLKIKTEYLDASVNIMEPSDFPEMPILNEPKEIEIPAKELKDALNKVIFAAARDESRPIFTGVLLETGPEGLNMVATDTHRLSLYTHQITNSVEIKTVVPGKAIKEVIRNAGGEAIKIQVDGKTVKFICGDTEITARAIDGEFPNYRQVIPTAKEEALLTINKARLLLAIERAMIFTDQQRIIRMKGDTSFSITGSSGLFGEIKEKLAIGHQGIEVTMAIDGEFLRRGIKAMTSEEVSIKYYGKFSPLIIQEKDYTQIVLPVRTE